MSAVAEIAAVEQKAAALNARFANAAPEAVLAAVIAEHPGKVALLSSFGTEAALSLSIVAEVAPETPVLFLETGMHFPQTIDYRHALAERLGLTDVRDLVTAPAHPSDPKQSLWRTDPDACCDLRKVQPLDRALPGFEILVTGRKRIHGAGRARLPLFEVIDGRLRLNLLVSLTPEELERRFAESGLPRHPLHEGGYTSIGCWPCTRAAETGDATSRSGRWAGSQKTECGIHLARPRVPAVSTATAAL